MLLNLNIKDYLILSTYKSVKNEIILVYIYCIYLILILHFWALLKAIGFVIDSTKCSNTKVCISNMHIFE